MHDFYAREWARLQERFDPSKGEPQNYVYVAFYRFARPRIARLQNWRRRCRDIQQLLEYPDTLPGPDEEAVVREEVVHVRKAIAQLRDQDRQILSDFLFAGHTSERKLAQRHALSRYEVRNILVNCFGQAGPEIARPLAGVPDGPARAAKGKLDFRRGRSPDSPSDVGRGPFRERRRRVVGDLRGSCAFGPTKVRPKPDRGHSPPLTLLTGGSHLVNEIVSDFLC